MFHPFEGVEARTFTLAGIPHLSTLGQDRDHASKVEDAHVSSCYNTSLSSSHLSISCPVDHLYMYHHSESGPYPTLLGSGHRSTPPTPL